MRTFIRTLHFGGFFILFLSIFSHPALAQNASFAQYISVSPTSIPNGSIVTAFNDTYEVSQEEYAKSMFGVYNQVPAVEIVPNDASGKIPVVQTGIALVLVNGSNGPIKEGDLITSSAVTGQGMRATKSGFTLGVAQAAFTPNSAEETILLPVFLDIKFNFANDAPASEQIISRLMSVVSLSTLSLVENPLQSLRYTIAGLTVVSSLAISFFTFSRVASKGVEAIGRNPLAKTSILTGVIFNSLLSIGLGAIGLLTAYVIISF